MDAIQRRSMSVRRRNLDDILVYMQTYADSEFEGDLQSHVLEIFNTLSEEEQKVLLRRSLMLQWERILDESKRELSQTSGFTHETENLIDIRAKIENEQDVEVRPSQLKREEESKHADKVRSWKDIGMRAFLIALILAMCFMLFSTVWLDENASFKGVWGLLDYFIGIVY